MKHSDGSSAKKRGMWRTVLRRAAFPASVAALYLVLACLRPGQAAHALRSSGHTLAQLAIPLCIAVTVMFLLNLLVKPAHISRFLGKGAGLRGIALSSAAGILSMGPIYAWYPLLKDLREKGASAFHLANFLGNRAVKPFLLPVMVFYFGWAFTVVLNVLIVLGALATAAGVSLVVRTNRGV